jgi:predicted transcriptional regulator
MKMTTSRVLASAFAILLAAGSGIAAGEPDVEQQATAAAEAWLELIDAGKYDDSWDVAAEYFKRVVKQEKWRDMAAAARGPLGPLLSREVKSAEHRTTLPGAPDGEYVVIQFATSFEHKKSAVETVTPMRDNDGAWRVSGYFIR